MTLSLLLLTATLSQFQAQATGNTHEDQVQACIRTCYAYIDKTGWELKACVAKCQKLAKP